MKKIFVSIIDYNGRENTLFCLDSLQKINKKGFEVHVVVIDNYPPKILKIPENYFKGLSLTLTKNKNTLGFSGGILDTKNVIAKHRGVDEVDKGQFDAVQETDFATGACFLIKKSVLEN